MFYPTFVCLLVCLFFCLLETSVRLLDHHENFTKEISLDKEQLIKLSRSSALDHEDPKTEKNLNFASFLV